MAATKPKPLPSPAPPPPAPPPAAPGPSPAGDAVEVYVVDTGIDPGNTNLNVVETRSFVPSEPTPGDLHGHGTFCSGIIGARGLSNQVTGVLPNVKLHGLKVLNSSGSGTFSSIIAALNYIYAAKMASPGSKMLVSMSLGATVGTGSYNILDTTIVKLINANVPVIVAAGNDSIDAVNDTPAHVKEALTVGAYDSSNKFAYFSNYGSVVDINGPGVDIKSTWLKNGTYIGSGTSFSCPHATGVLARYLSRNPMPGSVAALFSLLKSASHSGAVSSVPNGSTTTSAVYVF